MKSLRSLCYGLTWLAAAGTCLPGSIALGAEAESAPPVAKAGPQSGAIIRDVALQRGGLLIGQVFDETLQRQRGAEVTITTGGQTTASTTTDANGVFAVAGLRGGVHQVATGGTIESCRLWAAGTAPPQAAPELRVVLGQDQVIRGQWGQPQSFVDRTHEWLSNPWVIAGIVATAVAVPVILHNADDDDDEGS